VHGSVLVVEGVAYCAAGRSSHLDGGIHLLALDPTSGAILREQTLDTAPAAAQDKGGRGALADVLVFDGRSIAMRQNRFEPVAVEGRRPWRKDPRHLLATGGLLDDTWFNRIYWALNNRPLGQMLVFDEDSAYGIRSYARPGDVNAHFAPGKQGYRLFAHDYRKPPAPPRPGEKPQRRRNAPPEDRWGATVPIRARAFALAAGTLFLAGTPDTVDPDDPWASFDGRRGGLLRAVSTADGKNLAEYRLDAPPVYDGLAAARERLYLSTTDGAVRSFAGD
jgi:hypothetical protein